MNDQQAQEWAREFWRRVGHCHGSAQSLEAAVSWALPLAVTRIPRLTLEGLTSWLSDQHVYFRCEAPNRRLRAALVARGGHGMMFVEESDSTGEQRFSIAHEAVHFVRHYLAPRERALELLGNDALDILDGLRTATIEERLRGVLSHVELGTYSHLMDRSSAGDVLDPEVLAIEDEADRLALELLAPRAAVIEEFGSYGIDWQSPGAIPQAASVLRSRFGVPEPASAGYARYLVEQHRSQLNFQDWLGA